jgi:hypothetical protein
MYTQNQEEEAGECAGRQASMPRQMMQLRELIDISLGIGASVQAVVDIFKWEERKGT